MSEPTAGRRVALLVALALVTSASVLGALALVRDRPSETGRPAASIPAELMVVPTAERRSQVEPGSAVVLDEPDLGSPDEPSALTSKGCGLKQRPGTWQHRLRGGDYVLQVPEGYDPGSRYRLLIVVFSEKLRSLPAFLRNTGLTRLADEQGLVIVGVRPSEDPQTSSIEHIIEAARHASERVCLDEHLRYAIGHGDGGRRVRALRCALPLSAMATTGDGHKVGDEICQTAPTPFLHTFGLRDTRVPMKGGKGCFSGPFLSAPRIEADWAARNECEGRAKRYIRRGKSSCRIWTCAASLAFCELDGGHDWPGAATAVVVPGCDAPPADFPLLETIWDFFVEHGRPV